MVLVKMLGVNSSPKNIEPLYKYAVRVVRMVRMRLRTLIFVGKVVRKMVMEPRKVVRQSGKDWVRILRLNLA